MADIRRHRGWSFGFAAPVAAVFLAGCAGANQPASLALPALTAPAETASVSVSPTELYSRIARGANACWFSPGAPLDAQYIYNADAKPAAEGGAAEITIHVRDDSVQNPRGLKAFRVSIAPDSGGAGTAKLAVENLKMPEPAATRMKEDVQRWSRGNIACAEPGSEWAPKPPEPPPVTAEKRKKRPKAAKKAAQNDI